MARLTSARVTVSLDVLLDEVEGFRKNYVIFVFSSAFFLLFLFFSLHVRLDVIRSSRRNRKFRCTHTTKVVQIALFTPRNLRPSIRVLFFVALFCFFPSRWFLSSHRPLFRQHFQDEAKGKYVLVEQSLGRQSTARSLTETHARFK